MTKHAMRFTDPTEKTARQGAAPAPAVDLRNRLRAAASLADEGMYLATLETDGVLAGSRVFVRRAPEVIVPDFHVAEHDTLPAWHPERAACATCTPLHVITDDQFAANLEAATTAQAAGRVGTKR